MIAHITIYNKDQTDNFRITIEKEQIMLAHGAGVYFTNEHGLFDMLHKAFADKMIVGME